MPRYTFTAKDGTRVVFREPRGSDAPLMLRFINSITCEPMSGLMMNRPIRMKEELQWVARRIREIRQRTTVMLMVELDGRIVGNCDIVRRTYKEGHRATLGIALAKEARGKGIGEELMRRTISLAAQRMKGLEQVDLQTFTYNKRAQSLYRKLGFVKVGEMPRAIKEGERYYGELLMVLRLEKWKGAK